MKLSISLTFCALLLSACSTANYHYQSEQNPQKWEGQNISVVEKKWGTADQTFHTRNGTSYYIYSTTSGRNFFTATSTNFALAETNPEFYQQTQMGLQCTAIFKTNKNNIIIGTSHAGSNCGGEWAPNSRS